MKSKQLLWICAIGVTLLSACTQEEDDHTASGASTTERIPEEGPEGDRPDNVADVMEPPFYIINTAAVKSEEQAMEKVEELKEEGYDAAYLWIPDYESLSGAEYFSVYIGPFKTRQECAIAVDQYQVTNPKAYGTLVSHDPKREVVGGLNQATE